MNSGKTLKVLYNTGNSKTQDLIPAFRERERAEIGTLFCRIAVRLTKEGNVGVSGMNFSRVGHALGDVITVAPGIGSPRAADCQIDPPLQDDPDPGGVGMFGQIDILLKDHEDDLVCHGLEEVRRYPLQRYIGFGKSPNRFRKDL